MSLFKKKKVYVSGRFAFKTDIGRVRLSNEDQAYATVNARGNVLLLVCDGMGGQNKGDYASNLAKQIILEEFQKVNRFLNRYHAMLWMNRTIQKANASIYSQSIKSPVYEGMGTTLTLALIVGGTVVSAQIGDSRLYFLNREIGQFTQISEDQTYVGYLYRTGQITAEEMKTHPKRHMLMNALGVYPSASADIKTSPYVGQTLLLCSDGLYNNISDSDIESIVRGVDTIEEKINELISLANCNGGSDNIAVVLWEAQK